MNNYNYKGFSLLVLGLASTFFISGCSTDFDRLNNIFKDMPIRASQVVKSSQVAVSNQVTQKNVVNEVRIKPTKNISTKLAKKIAKKQKSGCLYIVRDLSSENATQIFCRPK